MKGCQPQGVTRPLGCDPALASNARTTGPRRQVQASPTLRLQPPHNGAAPRHAPLPEPPPRHAHTHTHAPGKRLDQSFTDDGGPERWGSDQREHHKQLLQCCQAAAIADALLLLLRWIRQAGVQVRTYGLDSARELMVEQGKGFLCAVRRVLAVGGAALISCDKERLRAGVAPRSNSCWGAGSGMVGRVLGRTCDISFLR